MPASTALANKDANLAMSAAATGAALNPNAKPDVKSMEYHRQVLQSKMAEQGQYVRRQLGTEDKMD